MILGQIQNNREVAIAYGGRKLNPAERNYSATEREALAVVAAIKHFQPYLYGRPFIVHTDHNALRWIQQVVWPARLCFCSSTILKSKIVLERTMLMQMAFLVGLTAPPLPPSICQACKLLKFMICNAKIRICQTLFYNLKIKKCFGNIMFVLL